MDDKVKKHMFASILCTARVGNSSESTLAGSESVIVALPSSFCIFPVTTIGSRHALQGDP